MLSLTKRLSRKNYLIFVMVFLNALYSTKVSKILHISEFSMCLSLTHM
jgi:hypothetical protein